MTAAPRVIVGTGAAVVLTDANGELAAEVATALASDDAFAAVVGVVGAHLRDLPAVAAVFAEAGGQRLLVRGSSVTAVGATGSVERYDGYSASTWVEHLVVGAQEVLVEVGSAVPVLLAVVAAGRPAAPAAAAGRPQRSRPLAAPAVTAHHEAGEEAPVAAAAETIDSSELPLPSPEGAADDDGEAGQEVAAADDEVAPTAGTEQSAPHGFDFGHLLEETHYRGVEAAAVRDVDDDADRSPVADAASRPSTPAAPGAGPGVPSAPPAPPAAPVLIDRVPGRSAQPPPASAAVAPAGNSGPDSDHDGRTVSLAELRGRTGQLPGQASIPTVPQVRAVRCPSGHPNAPTATSCRRCRAPIVDHSIELVPRPSMGRLRFDDGMVVEIDRPLLIGRKPTSGRDVPADHGTLSVPDPDKALSRLHLEVRLEEWQVLVVDRRSSNGTVVELPGHEPVQIRPGDPCLLVPGARVRLGDVSSFVYEVGG